VYLADSGLYSAENMTVFNQAEVRWVSRVAETSTEAHTIIHEIPAAWQSSADQTRQWWSRVLDLPQGWERWIVVRHVSGSPHARTSCHVKHGAILVAVADVHTVGFVSGWST
jgi:hypothetical protein